jgi:hypothetical protein
VGDIHLNIWTRKIAEMYGKENEAPTPSKPEKSLASVRDKQIKKEGGDNAAGPRKEKRDEVCPGPQCRAL